MLTGKMTATWLIIITMAGIIIVPLMIIYFAMLLPYDQAHPDANSNFILGLITIIPNVSISCLNGGPLI
jgi:hypothetical protein